MLEHFYTVENFAFSDATEKVLEPLTYVSTLML